MKRQFDAACRQYQVKKPVELENLWINSVKWPLNGISYDPDTQTYTIPAGMPAGTSLIHTLTSPIPAGTTLTATVFFDGGYYEASRTAIYIGGVDSSNGWQAYSGCPKSTDLSGKRYSRTAVTTAPLTKFGIHLGANVDLSVKEPITFRMMLTVGETKAEAFKPYGIDKYGWADGLKSGFPSVKMLGQTEQQTYQGINALDIAGCLDEGYSNTVNGVTAQVKGGYAVLSGTHTNSGWSNVLTVTYPLGSRPILKAGTYSLPELAYGTFAVSLYDLTTEASIGNKAGVFTIENDCSVTGAYIAVRTEKSFSESVPLVLAFGANPATTYEPYTGGIPAPNPQYPQEVKSNNATIRSCGRNLFNMLAFEVQSERDCGITAVGQDGIIVTSVSSYEGNGVTVTDKLLRDVAPGLVRGRTYTLSLTSDSQRNPFLYLSRTGVWLSGQSMVVTEEMLLSKVYLYGFRQFDGEGTGDCRISQLQIEEGTAVTPYEPYFDGGEAIAPNLMCAVDGSCQSTYDPQTGVYVNWWWDKIVFDGSENWEPYSVIYPDGNGANGYVTHNALSERMSRNAYWSNQTPPGKKELWDDRGAFLWCGVNSNHLFALDFGVYDDTLEDYGLANWKAHLAEHPLEVWVARNEPEITNIGPQRLTCPTGYGQIIQVSGDIPSCPLEIKYLAHGGNVK